MMQRRRQRITADDNQSPKRRRQIDLNHNPPSTSAVKFLEKEEQTKKKTRRFLEEFEILSKIGEGAYGLVYKGKDKHTGEILAIKKLKEQSHLDSLPEIEILASMNHPSIVNLKHVVMENNNNNNKNRGFFLVMEYAENDVRSLLETMKQPFIQCEVKCLMQQLLQGVEYLHSNKVIHRDLKTSNLLLNNRGELKICDFGLAYRLNNDDDDDNDSILHREEVVTLWYRAPELLLGARSYSTEIDMWSVGCIMAELMSRQPLFDGKTEVDQIGKIFKTLGNPNEKMWPGLSELPGVKGVKVSNFVKHGNTLRERFPAVSFTGAAPVVSGAGFDLLSRLLTYDPKKRITAEEARNHAWFREVPLPKCKDFMPTFPPNFSNLRRNVDLDLGTGLFGL
ncbi:Protein kinase superfamily protein [Perilla frutescens var. hirtella]|uniref:Protein kinase superfamily protein n=1 Tax=Perilla frutescens var. hirtella TaxID=608512 RepID=A0AAD4J5D5_PERFH|nr:Protein kinase superfamily protein [Perilla frutescens var. hirtella]